MFRERGNVMNQFSSLPSLHAMIDAEVFGARGEWEKHEIAGHAAYVKPMRLRDAELKARVAARYDELGFVPVFFRESGKDFVALEGIKEKHRYRTVEEAFVQQILTRLG
jgi:hypothetical protein